MESKNKVTQENSICVKKGCRNYRPRTFALLLTHDETELLRREIKKSGLTTTDFMLSLAGKRPPIERRNAGTALAILRCLKTRLSDILDRVTKEGRADPETLRYAGKVLNKAERLEKSIWRAYAVGGSNEPRKK